MRTKTVMCLMCAVLVGGTGIASNLLTNGSFEQELNVGWTQEIDNLAGEVRFERWDTLGQPVPGYAAKVYKYLAYYAKLYQVADVPDASVTLAFDARLQMAGGSSTCWPTGAVVACYQDDAGTELGCTMFILRNEYNTWVESDTMHFYDVELPGEWVHYELDIAREIADNLPGVDAGAVRKVEIQLFSYTNGT